MNTCGHDIVHQLPGPVRLSRMGSPPPTLLEKDSQGNAGGGLAGPASFLRRDPGSWCYPGHSRRSD